MDVSSSSRRIIEIKQRWLKLIVILESIHVYGFGMDCIAQDDTQKPHNIPIVSK